MAQRMNRLKAVVHAWKLVTLSLAESARGSTSKAGPPTPSVEMASENKDVRSIALALATCAVAANIRSKETYCPRAMRISRRCGKGGKARGAWATAGAGTTAECAEKMVDVPELPGIGLNPASGVLAEGKATIGMSVVVVTVGVETCPAGRSNLATKPTNCATDCCNHVSCCLTSAISRRLSA